MGDAMQQFRPILVVSIIFTAIAAVMWGAVIRTGPRVPPVDLTGAGTAAVIAGMCWLALWRARVDRDKTVLVKTLARTLPLRRVP
jgi:hypothetical protein